MTTTVNITAYNDADFYRVFQYVVASTGAPIDITGVTMWMMLRRHAADAECDLRLGTDTGEIALINPAIGQWTIFVPQETLARLGTGDWEHSLIMQQISGLKQGVWVGTFTNNAGPSR